MKIKAAYYLRALPTKIAVVLPDDRAMIADLTPSRVVTEAELKDLEAFHSSARRAAMLVDEIPEYAYSMYGFERAD